MTKHIDDFLNIPHAEDINEEHNAVDTTNNNSSLIATVDSVHSKEVDEVRKKALDLQEEIAEVARNVEPSRSARMFEVSGQHLKLALEASNVKEKMKIESAKLKLEAARLHIEDESISSLNNGAEIIEDRNELIRQLKAEEENNIIDVEVEEK